MAATPPAYMSGFGNEFETEALAGRFARRPEFAAALRLRALCRAAFRLTLHGAARRKSAVLALSHPSIVSARARRFRRPTTPLETAPARAKQDRPILVSSAGARFRSRMRKLTFVAGVRTMTTAGDVNTRSACRRVFILSRQSMIDEYFYNADGELLIVPQQGALLFSPNSAASTLLRAKSASFRAASNSRSNSSTVPRGDICVRITARTSPFPNRGPIGANCLANPRDFKTPVAAFEDRETACR